ncbi:MAG: hypothetical protein F6J93_00065 [Oscillatoria sp. SIO1A7]|nr:hypothetical protein [Oscillatoria sp. SIO1A7]
MGAGVENKPNDPTICVSPINYGHLLPIRAVRGGRFGINFGYICDR